MKSLICLCFFFATPIASASAQTASTESELLAGAHQRIEKYRKIDGVIRVVDRDGESVSGAQVRIEQTRHGFMFGCNAFPLLGHRDPALAAVYQKQFADLFNYATLGIYWGAYEREQGKTDEVRVRAQAEWCQERGILVKGHPLVWHEVFPRWGPAEADSARDSQRKRVIDIVGKFAGLIDIWDVVNEATVAERFQNGIGRWAKRDGTSRMVGGALEWARGANPRARLLYNDFNVGPDYEDLARELVKDKAPLGALGIQSHMHSGEWTLQRAWDICETYSKFGKPLHFTELTVLSGEHGWQRPLPWRSTSSGELRQAEYVEKLYTLLFSHPAVAAITWWDLMDGAWQGAPAGLVRADLSPKPAYSRLLARIKGTWWTQQEAVTDSHGEVHFRGFLGDFRVIVKTSGLRLERPFVLKQNTRNRLLVHVP